MSVPGDDRRLRSARLHADPERLRAQAELSWPKEFQRLQQAGLRDGMAVLDVGCGPGHVARLLLDRLPNVTLTGVELDPEMRALAEAGWSDAQRPRVEVMASSALSMDLPDDHFDFALARLLFQHLSVPRLAADEIFCVLKPGGVLAVIDADDGLGGLLYPEVATFGSLARRVAEHQMAQGGSREVGRRLPSILREAGFVDLTFDVVAFSSLELGMERFWPQYDPRRYGPLVEAGAVAPAELDAYRDEITRFFAAPGSFIVQLLLVATGVKPTGQE